MRTEYIGNLELRLCDCMVYMAECPDKHFDLAIVDPPYGRKEHGGTNRTHNVKQKNGSTMVCRDGGYTKKDWDNEPPPPEYFIELKRVSKHQIIWGMNYQKYLLTGGAIVWDKVNDGADQSGCEIASNSLNERVDIFRYMWRGMMQGESVQNGTRQQGNKALNEKRIHPTQKPVKLYQWLLQNYAKPGQYILDTHLGSGSHAVAAHYSGMNFTGIEKDPHYFGEMITRVTNETSQLSMAL